MEEVKKWMTRFSWINGLYILSHFLLFLSMLNIQSILSNSTWMDDYPGSGNLATYWVFFYFSFCAALIPGFFSEIGHLRKYKTLKGKRYWTGWSKFPFYIITAYSRSWAYKLNLTFTAIMALSTPFSIFVGISSLKSTENLTGFLGALTFGHPFIEFWIILLLQPKITKYCKESFARVLADVINRLRDDDVVDNFNQFFNLTTDNEAYLLMDYYREGNHIPKLHAFGINSSINFKPVPLGLFLEKNYHFGTDRDYEGLTYNLHKGEIWTKDGTYESTREYNAY